MSRPLRLEFSGALYHISSRGNEKRPIFLEDTDFKMFLSLMAEVCRRYNWVIHSYCLMTNHYHLIVETPDGNLSRGMRHLNGVYTQRFNSKHKRVGHLFQGRYKAILVDKDSYLLELCRYVVLNPVRANMVKEPSQWQWSSYLATLGKQQGFEGLATDSLLLQFDTQRNQAREKFQVFISQGIGKNIWSNLRQQIYLGNDDFVSKNLQRLTVNKSELSEVPLKQHRKPAKTLKEYEEKNSNRNAAVKDAYSSGAYTMKELASYFGCHYSTISRIIAKCKT
ncbi:MAG: addiction module toxin RelE [Methyloprofundus sp.]|nr:addiction module toxin RelE [Methyloprofundus sp.]